jgi:histone-lysine N-methyltransferase SETD1
VDATVSGGLARFINHGCDPNCITHIYTAPGGGSRIGIFGLRWIQPGEELFYDYKVGSVIWRDLAW